MEINSKKLKTTSKLINYFIAIILCGFLISLSGKLIYDVDDWKKEPSIIEFEDATLLAQKKYEIDTIKSQIEFKLEKKINVENTIKIVNNNYENAKQSFDNWLDARKTVGSPKEDKAVLSRAKELDKYYKTQQEWKNELSKIGNEIRLLRKNKIKTNSLIKNEKDRAYKAQRSAIRKYELKIFLIRLLFILPILLLGVFFIVRYRKHKYWPLFLGFIMFSFYAFFFGLIPYLPSYGGYIRSIVGIILCVTLGIYAINKIKKFIENKNNELKVSNIERAKKIQSETAEKALDSHICPSCGKDFILKKWDKSKKDPKETVTYGVVTNYCRFCGLELFKECTKCGSENFAHLPYCSNCGEHINKEK